MREPLQIIPGPGGLFTVEGSLDGDDAAALAGALSEALARTPAGPLTLDLDGLDLEDGVSVARTVSALRSLLTMRSPLTLRAAPQMLAHTLYKIGALRDGRLLLDAPREEEPTTAN